MALFAAEAQSFDVTASRSHVAEGPVSHRSLLLFRRLCPWNLKSPKIWVTSGTRCYAARPFETSKLARPQALGHVRTTWDANHAAQDIGFVKEKYPDINQNLGDFQFYGQGRRKTPVMLEVRDVFTDLGFTRLCERCASIKANLV
jgi:hypothetical protein